ncbi:hypothetical protein [uncultured Cedecea sp.]|nr:hypothetical protein [uncultured Cedecea sp.]
MNMLPHTPNWSRTLLPLGKIDQGLEILSQPGPYNLHIERMAP